MQRAGRAVEHADEPRGVLRSAVVAVVEDRDDRRPRGSSRGPRDTRAGPSPWASRARAGARGRRSPAGASLKRHCTAGENTPGRISRVHIGVALARREGRAAPRVGHASAVVGAAARAGPRVARAASRGAEETRRGSVAPPPARRPRRRPRSRRCLSRRLRPRRARRLGRGRSRRARRSRHSRRARRHRAGAPRAAAPRSTREPAARGATRRE